MNALNYHAQWGPCTKRHRSRLRATGRARRGRADRQGPCLSIAVRLASWRSPHQKADPFAHEANSAHRLPPNSTVTDRALSVRARGARQLDHRRSHHASHSSPAAREVRSPPWLVPVPCRTAVRVEDDQNVQQDERRKIHRIRRDTSQRNWPDSSSPAEARVANRSRSPSEKKEHASARLRERAPSLTVGIENEGISRGTLRMRNGKY